MTKAGGDGWAKHASLAICEYKRFKTSVMTEDQFNCLVFVGTLQFPNDANIRVKILSKIEKYRNINMQK